MFSTETLDAQLAVLPEASVAVHVSVVVPTGNVLPDGGLHDTVSPGQLSDATGGANVTRELNCPNGTKVTMLAGQVIAGGWVSLTVIVNEHEGPAVLVTFTVVVALGKKLPEAGAAVTVPHAPVVVGAGYETTAPH
jgi:hypothetical protein